MTELSARNFGLLIAYVLPGFVALWGLASVSESVRLWLQGAGETGPTVGGVLYVVLSSIAAGMTASVLRWAVLDTVLHRSGLSRPSLDFARLQEHLAAFDRLVEWHYQYYQFYGNTVVAAFVAYPLWRGGTASGGWPTDLAFIVLEVTFYAGARDALRNFYSRTRQLLGLTQESSKETSHDQRIGTSRNEQAQPHQALADPAPVQGAEDDEGGRTPGSFVEGDDD